MLSRPLPYSAQFLQGKLQCRIKTHLGFYRFLMRMCSYEKDKPPSVLHYQILPYLLKESFDVCVDTGFV